MKKKVQVVILTPENQTLVFKTNRDRGSFWQNVTGSVDTDEDFLEAAIRELCEETGLESQNAREHIVALNTEFFFTDRKERNVHEKVYYYFGPQWEVTMSDEHVDYKWMNASEVTIGFFKYHSNFQALEKSLEKLSQDLK